MEIQINEVKFKVSNEVDEIVHKFHKDIHFWEAVNKGTWEMETFEVLDQFLSQGAVMLDMGAWAGPISLYAASKGAFVHAIDPDATIFKVLQKNIQLNKNLQANIQTYPIAITAENKQVALNAKEAYGLSTSSILNRINDNVSSIEVSGISLETFIKQKQISTVNFIKMDVEGAEFDILPSWTKTLQDLERPTLLLAFHYNFLNESIYNNKIKFRPIAKALMKMERLFKTRFFGSSIKRKFEKAINALSDYEYMYLDNGKAITKKHLLNNLLLTRKHSIVFTNVQWDKENRIQ